MNAIQQLIDFSQSNILKENFDSVINILTLNYTHISFIKIN